MKESSDPNVEGSGDDYSWDDDDDSLWNDDDDGRDAGEQGSGNFYDDDREPDDEDESDPTEWNQQTNSFVPTDPKPDLTRDVSLFAP